jgi:hypothetical protein
VNCFLKKFIDLKKFKKKKDFDVNRVLIIHYENIFKISKNIVLNGENTLYFKYF